MTTLEPQDKVIVLRHLAALMRRGVPLGEALAIITEGLPVGETRSTLTQFQQALGRGEVPADTHDPFLSMLARAEVAGPEAIGLAADSYDGEAFTAIARETGYAYLLMLLGVVTLAGCVAAVFVVPGLREIYHVSHLPKATPGAMAGIQYVAPMLLLALIGALLFRSKVAAFTPGSDGLECAARLRLYAAGLRAGVDDNVALSWMDSMRSRHVGTSERLGMTDMEVRLLHQLAGDEGLASGVQVVADERESAALRQYRRWLASAPSILGVLLLWAIGGVIFALYLPIFFVGGAR